MIITEDRNLPIIFDESRALQILNKDKFHWTMHDNDRETSV